MQNDIFRQLTTTIIVSKTIKNSTKLGYAIQTNTTEGHSGKMQDSLFDGTCYRGQRSVQSTMHNIYIILD